MDYAVPVQYSIRHHECFLLAVVCSFFTINIEVSFYCTVVSQATNLLSTRRMAIANKTCVSGKKIN